jgi:uncharacterized phage protein (TIGR02218 family)
MIADDRRGFSAVLRSGKHLLERDLVPRTSPTCRAAFCGPGCGLAASRFTQVLPLAGLDLDFNRVRFAGIPAADHLDGLLRFRDGPQTGISFGIVSADDDWLMLDRPLAAGTVIGTLAELREGCDHIITTCSTRFANARNFRGEPFLPGNDLLTRYGRN